jgi:hypothetical protein
VAILRAKNIKTQIKNTLRIYLKMASFYLKFRAKIEWVLAILRGDNIEIKIKKRGAFTRNMHYFLQNFELK